MASYGVQFEALMAEVCRDFGRRLIRGWDEGANKEEVRKYVEDSVAAFFNKPTKEVLSEEPEAEEEETPKKKSKAKPKKAKKSEPESDYEAEITVESPKKKAKSKSKASSATTKAKCKAVTAKGAPCSKNAVDGCEFCNVHRDKGTPLDKGESSVKDKGESSVKPKEKAKKAPAKAKASKPESAKHAETHGPDETDPENCELCKSHGGPFELPDYEAENDDKDPDFDIDDEEVEGGSLTEEDFDEDF